MREALEAQFNCTILQWNEPTDDCRGVVFSALVGGRLVMADSLSLLISALQECEHRPLMLLAA